MQTSREAIQAMFRGEQADLTPFYDSPWGETTTRWLTEGYPKDEKGNAQSATEVCDFCMAGCGGWFEWQAKRGPEQIVDETDEWKVVLNGNGAKTKWWKHKSGTPEHVDFHMTSRAIWEEEYRPHLVDNPAVRMPDDAVERAVKEIERWQGQNRWSFFGHQFLWENIRASLGDINMFMAMADDPEWIRDMGRVYTDLYKTCYGRLLDGGARPDGIWIYEDLGYRDRLFCSPALLEDLVFPFWAQTQKGHDPGRR